MQHGFARIVFVVIVRLALVSFGKSCHLNLGSQLFPAVTWSTSAVWFVWPYHSPTPRNAKQQQNCALKNGDKAHKDEVDEHQQTCQQTGLGKIVTMRWEQGPKMFDQSS